MTAAEVLKVADLVSTTSFETTVLAGNSGLQREVLWAHSCELPDPERWLGPHELLMTVGLCVPEEPSEQARFIARLDDAGLAGLMIGDHETTPKISSALVLEADRREFPVLWVATQTPYAVIARHVAAANMDSQLMLVLELSKFYHVTADADDPGELVQKLATLLRVDIRVDDLSTGLTVLSGAHASHAEPTSTPRRYPLRGQHPAELILSEYPGEALEGMLLVHLLKVLQVTTDRVLSDADHQRTAGAYVLRELLNGEQPRDADALFHPYQASDGFCVVAFDSAHAAYIARLAALRSLPMLVGPSRTGHLALLPTDVVPLLRSLIEPRGMHCGASSVFIEFKDAPAAASEAARALASPPRAGTSWTEFKGAMVPVLSRSRQESDEIIEGVLGPLADASAAATKLRDTLFTFLRNDRRWQDTADELGIHRQTLSYRLKRIEEMTGADVARTSDLSAFWIAYQAWQSVHG